jgi:RNA polymerase sigma-70 factor (ECF subfamily)
MSDSLAQAVYLPLARVGEAAACEPASRVVAQAFHQCRDALYRHALIITHNPHEAEEIVQEGFLKLQKQVLRGRRIDNLRAWLFRVVHNSAIDLGRARRDSASLSDSSNTRAVEERLADHVLCPERIYLESERRRRLARATGLLSPLQQHCLYLRKEGLTYREIASVLGIGETTVVDHLARSIARLHQELHEK